MFSIENVLNYEESTFFCTINHDLLFLCSTVISNICFINVLLEL